MKRIILSFILLISLIFLSSCNYKASWQDSKLTYYGETSDYIISTDSYKKFHISDISRNALGKTEFVIPKSVIINNEEIIIDYVDDIFSSYTPLRKITIEFNKHEIKLSKCKNLRIIEIDEKNIINPNSFLSNIKDKYVYITNSTKDYSVYNFYKHNTVNYEQSPDSTYTISFITSNDKMIMNLIIINLIISIITAILLIIYHKVYEPFHILSISSSILLLILPIIISILGIIFINNNLWILGILLVIPFIIGVNALLILDDSNLFKVLTIILTIISFILSYYVLYNILPQTLLDVYVTTNILLLLCGVLYYLCYNNKILTVLGTILFPLIITISIKLLDLMYYYGFKSLIGSIICTLIQGISYLGLVISLCLFVLAIVAVFKDYTITQYKPTYININEKNKLDKENQVLI